jgi:hypothetical protein
MLENIIFVVIGLGGILGGLLLSFIAPEELNKGKKYFFILKRALFIAIMVLNSYFIFLKDEMITLVVVMIIGVMLLIFDFVISKRIYQILNYVYLFVIPILINTNINPYLIYSLIFIYGLPTGTLLRKMHNGP